MGKYHRRIPPPPFSLSFSLFIPCRRRLANAQKFNFPGYTHKQKTEKFLFSYSRSASEKEKRVKIIRRNVQQAVRIFIFFLIYQSL